MTLPITKLRGGLFPKYRLVDIDGDAFELEFDIDENYHAIHWDGNDGYVETRSGKNFTIFNVSEFEDIISLHAVKLKEVNDEKAAAEKEREDYLNSWDYIRDQRDVKISETDWTQMPDSPLYNNQAWLDYRQALRDVTEVETPDDVVWPTKPQGE